MLFKIGDFSKLCRIPVKTLRFYDECGLFKPVEIDTFTGYRYYSANQLPRLNRILALKELGFSLDQIRQVVEEGLNAEQLRGMLRLKQAEIQQRMADEAERLSKVEARLRLIEREQEVSRYDILVKQVAPQWVVSLRVILPAYAEVGRLFGELFARIPLSEVHMTGAIWHDSEYKEQDIDTEALIFLRSRVSATGANIYELPATTVASVVHHGPFASIHNAYSDLLAWIEANSYQIAGPSRELYLHTQGPFSEQNAENVTEIQFPVSKGHRNSAVG